MQVRAPALDGVYARSDHGELVFHELPAPTATEVADVARRTDAQLSLPL